MKTNPAVILESEPQWLHPLQTGPATLLALARDASTFDAVTAVLERLVPDAYIDHMRRYYAAGRERFGAHWSYADQLTVLHAAARVLRPRTYLEIGVFRGRSLSVVAAAAPECALHAFDLWIAGYAGLDNAGPDLVREQLRRVGHRGDLHVESGDSHETVPRFLEHNPDLGFDLVTVDGDHTEEGARRDLETVLPRVNVGGALVFDDIRHPRHPWLERVWDDTVGALPSFACAKFVEVGSGVAVAVRRQGDDAVIGALHGDGESRLAQLAQALDELRAKRVERIEVLETEMERRLEVIVRQGLELDRLRPLQTEVGRIPALEAELAHVPALQAEIDRLRAHVEFAEDDRAARLRVIEEQGRDVGRIPALEAEIARLRAHVEFAEGDRARRLEVIEEQGGALGRVPVLEAELAQVRERLRHAEAEHARGLRAAEQQRAALGRLPALEAEIARLRAQVEFAEGAHAKALRVVEEQGVALTRVPALEAELSRLSEYLQRVEADRAERLEVLLRLSAELGRLRAAVADQLALLQAWVERHMSGLFQRRHGRALLTMLGEAGARLGVPAAATPPAGGNGAAATGPTGDDRADAAPETPALAAVAPHDLAASNPRAH